MRHPIDLSLVLSMLAAAIAVCPACAEQVSRASLDADGHCPNCHADRCADADERHLAALDYQDACASLDARRCPTCDGTRFVHGSDGPACFVVCPSCEGGGYASPPLLGHTPPAHVAIPAHDDAEEFFDPYPDAETLIARHSGVAEARTRYQRSVPMLPPAPLATRPMRDAPLVRCGTILPVAVVEGRVA